MSRTYWAFLATLIALFVTTFPNYAQEDHPDTPIPNDPALRDVTLPEFIVIYDYPVEGITLNLRMIVRAKSEGEAVMRATTKLLDTFRNQLETSKLKFIEVAPRRNPDEKKK